MAKKSGALSLLLEKAKKYPLLTKEEDLEIGRKMADLRIKISDTDIPPHKKAELEKELKACIDKLINHNLRLVVSNAFKFTNQEQLMNLISEGNDGLMIAAKKYDHTRNCKFATHATWWIRAKMLRHMDKLKKRGGIIDEPDAVSDDNSNNFKLSDDDIEIIKKIFTKAKLTKKEVAVMELRFGLSGDLPQSIVKTAEFLGISVEQVRIREAGAELKLKELMEKDKEIVKLIKEDEELNRFFNILVK